jgi:hypothetical protein
VFPPFWVLWFNYDWQGFIIYLGGKPKTKCLHGMVGLNVQDREDNNIATTPISFFSSFNKIKSSWLAILFLT